MKARAPLGSHYLTAKHPELGVVWAAVDPHTHHLAGKVEGSRFAAFLAPFQTPEEAREALAAAGAMEAVDG